MELKKYSSTTTSSETIVVAKLYPDPTRPVTYRKIIDVPEEFDTAMKKLIEIINKRLGIKNIIYYKTSADMRLRKEGDNIVLARIYPKKRNRALRFDISNREKTTGRIHRWFRMEISIDDITSENETKLLPLLEKLKEAYKNLYKSAFEIS